MHCFTNTVACSSLRGTGARTTLLRSLSNWRGVKTLSATKSILHHRCTSAIWRSDCQYFLLCEFEVRRSCLVYMSPSRLAPWLHVSTLPKFLTLALWLPRLRPATGLDFPQLHPMARPEHNCRAKRTPRPPIHIPKYLQTSPRSPRIN